MRFADTWKLVWRHNTRNLSIPHIFISTWAPLIYMFGFGIGLAEFIPAVEERSYLSYLSGATPFMVAIYRASVEITPQMFGRLQAYFARELYVDHQFDSVLFSEWVCAAIQSFLSGGMVLLVTVIAGLAYPPFLAYSILALLLASFGFVGLSFAIWAMIRAGAVFQFVSMVLVIPVIIISGTFFPTHTLPGWLQSVANALPLSHAISLGRPLLLGQPTDGAPFHAFALMLYAVLGYLFVASIFKRRTRKLNGSSAT
jgi:lipooligosaccharide transport system permease protein